MQAEVSGRTFEVAHNHHSEGKENQERGPLNPDLELTQSTPAQEKTRAVSYFEKKKPFHPSDYRSKE